MSDFSVDSYEIKDKEGNAESPFTGGLSKAQHRNPDIHVLGDNLPAEILAYQAGSATLLPDIANNTPALLRQSFEVIGSAGGNQNLTTTVTQIANLSQVVSCPLQASGSPFIKVFAQCNLYGTATGGGAVNYCWVELQANGVFQNGSRQFWERIYGVNVDIIPIMIMKKIPITPGQTLTITMAGAQISPGGFAQQYAASALVDRALLNCELYY